MRTLWRNKTPFWYCQYEGKAQMLDENGYANGEWELKYSEPVITMGNVQDVHDVRTGNDLTPFGVMMDTDKIIIVEERDCPINETSMLYVDVKPGEGVKPDYRVRKVVKPLNGDSGITISVRRVTQS